jgi:hypothetical protein
MAHGLQIINDSGTVIINEEFNNMLVVSSGVTDNSSFANGAGLGSGDDIVWVRPHVLGERLYFVSLGGAAALLSSSSGYIEWCITRRNPTPSSDAFGLRVYRSDGSVAFDGGRSPVCPVLNYRDTNNEATDGLGATTMSSVGAPFAPASGRKRFAPLNCFRRFITWGVVSTTAYYVHSNVVFLSDGNLQVGAEMRFANSSAASVIYRKPTGAIWHFFADIVI